MEPIDFNNILMYINRSSQSTMSLRERCILYALPYCLERHLFIVETAEKIFQYVTTAETSSVKMDIQREL